MSGTLTRPDPSRSEHATARTRVRHTAMCLAGIIAVLYGLIASHLVTVIAGPAEQVARDQLGFALPAAGVYALGAFLLWRFDRRMLWIAGSILQVLVIAMYVMVAPQREPAFEVWGVTIRVFQFALLVATTYLAIRSSPRTAPANTQPPRRVGSR